jgi:hypothetical protein
VSRWAWWAWLREAIYGLSLLVAVVLLAVSIGGDYLGTECSYETGYHPEVGFIGAAPLGLVWLGLIELIIAAVCGLAHAWPRHVAIRLGLVGFLVMALSVTAFAEVGITAMNHSCD